MSTEDQDSPRTAINVAEAKRQFSDLLGRVAYAGETIVITRRGRPMAKLVPVSEDPHRGNELSAVEGWLDADDPFFSIAEEIVDQRRRHAPRVLAKRPKGRKNR